MWEKYGNERGIVELALGNRLNVIAEIFYLKLITLGGALIVIWMIAANGKMYNHLSAFAEYGFIDWRQKANYEIGDTVYIYCTEPFRKVMYRCEVTQINMPFSQRQDDKEYWVLEEEYNKAKSGNFARLKLIELVDSEYLELDKLKLHGLKAVPHEPIKVNDSLNMYLAAYFNDYYYDWTDEQREAFRTSLLNIRFFFYKGCTIEKSRTSHGAPKWLLYLGKGERMLHDSFPTKELAMDYIDEREEDNKISNEKQKAEEKYKYPKIDRSEFVARTKIGFKDSRVVNIGYAEGILSDGRPYRLECWAEEQLTNLTIFVSNMGIEHYSSQDVLDYLKTEGLFWRLKDDRYGSDGSVLLFRENNGDEFWSVNLLVGDDEETYLDSIPITKWDYQWRKNKWQSNR